MNKAAIFHRTYSEYSFATSPKRVVVRLRTAKADLDGCWICYGDRMDSRNPIAITRTPMEVRFSDNLFDYYEAIFDPMVTRLCYYFELQKGTERTYYYNDGFFPRPHENRQLYYNFHYIRTEDIAHVPEWFARAVIYQIYPDSFASSKGFLSGKARQVEADGQLYASKYGGTIRGILENLTYLQELGITCIYLTPIFAANSWHKYDTVDYFEIDPCFGTKAEFRELVRESHEKGIRVVLDGVFNHCGSGFFAFRDLMEKGERSRYREWFFPKGFPLHGGPEPNYECFAYVDFMPKLNTGNPEVMKYLLDVGTYWIREFNIDGWRLDVANEIHHDFWREYRKAIRAVKSDAVLIGEIWDDARSFLAGDQFDSAMNYNLTFAMVDMIAREKLTAEEFANRVSYLLMRYREPIQQSQMNLIDSHDVPRFLSQAGENRRKLKLAILFLMTHVGAPMIFYGDEQGLSGWNEMEYRKPMDWTLGDTELFAFYQKTIRLRRQFQEAILFGYQIFFADREVLVYGCENRQSGFLAAMNLSNHPQRRTLPVPEGLTEILSHPVDAMTSGACPVEGDSLVLSLEPWSAILIPTEE